MRRGVCSAARSVDSKEDIAKVPVARREALANPRRETSVEKASGRFTGIW
jgi:hypothetical protein